MKVGLGAGWATSQTNMSAFWKGLLLIGAATTTYYATGVTCDPVHVLHATLLLSVLGD